MTEWHITPDYIMNNWTDELFTLMCEKLVERKKRELDALTGKKSTSDDELLAKMGIKVKKKNGA